MTRTACLTGGVTALALMMSASAADMDWSKVDRAVGRKGADQPGGVHKFSFPRSDPIRLNCRAPVLGGNLSHSTIS